MNRILEIDRENMLAVVQPGVIKADLEKAVAEHGLAYPPDWPGTTSPPWRDPETTARAEAALDDIVVAALDLGGTVTGEHGVGTLKRRHLGRELGAENHALHEGSRPR
jgi:FAD/FMN-containing dehydrogenase